ncbi:MAG TPA: thymidine kinase [Bacteroidales bacterium]|nr:thymidine kinase [Bacteroidales bacterium]HRZ50118.1 thymidine kinase [Bacteroidales bacterium]
MYDTPSEIQRIRGCIEVICGSMFSGKTEELIRRMRRAQLAKQKTVLFKPTVDNRYHTLNIVSHDERFLASTPVESASQILLLVHDAEVVGIDEAQFFDPELVHVCNTLANQGVRVIVAGLDMDYLGVPFGPMPELLAVAEYVTKVHAVCMQCGAPALYSFRKSPDNKRVLLGEADRYEPLCRSCFNLLKKS